MISMRPANSELGRYFEDLFEFKMANNAIWEAWLDIEGSGNADLVWELVGRAYEEYSRTADYVDECRQAAQKAKSEAKEAWNAASEADWQALYKVEQLERSEKMAELARETVETLLHLYFKAKRVNSEQSIRELPATPGTLEE